LNVLKADIMDMRYIRDNPGVIADENVPPKDVDVLERYGLRPACVKDIMPGMSDRDVEVIAERYGIPVATYDRHFEKYRPVILLKHGTPIKKTLDKYLGYA
jgi:hypothetical protein